jgi:hypothetical protein
MVLRRIRERSHLKHYVKETLGEIRNNMIELKNGYAQENLNKLPYVFSPT